MSNRIHPSHTESDGALRAQIQDDTAELVGLKFTQLVNLFTLSAGSAINSRTLNCVAGHGIVVGNILCIKENARFYQGTATVVAGNVITVDTPLDFALTTAAVCERCIDNMAVDGSVTPRIFRLAPPAGAQWDIYGVSLGMLDNDPMDDSLFGGMAALTNGIVLRKKDLIYKNIFNIKSNGDFAYRCDEYKYADKAPAGVFGISVKKTFNIRHGIAIRLKSDLSDEIQVIIQDNLTTLSSFRAAAWGHTVTQ